RARDRLIKTASLAHSDHARAMGTGQLILPLACWNNPNAFAACPSRHGWAVNPHSRGRAAPWATLRERVIRHMNSSPQRFKARWFAMPGVCMILGSTFGCSGGEEVNPARIAAAWRLWTQAGIRDYHLEWTVTGPRNNHYFVSVRDGQVRKV